MKYLFLLVLSGLSIVSSAQPGADSSKELDEVMIVNSLLDPVSFTPVSIDLRDINSFKRTDLVASFNTVPSVRMEERSPGSYRLSIRGSLIRSPFGVRNVKTYLDEIPLTDASGNTYINLLDPNGVHAVTILPGPDDGLYGAATGGTVLFRLEDTVPGRRRVAAGVQYGSYNLLREHTLLGWNKQKFSVNVYQAYQSSDGYRENSAMKRWQAHTAARYRYSRNSSIKLLALFADLRYRTPGGLTLEQTEQNPRAARPATATSPGAAEQQAGIHNRSFLGGLVHESRISSRVRHTTAVSVMLTDFENPFITNYETRKENCFSFRSWFDGQLKTAGDWRINVLAGWEGQQMLAVIRNYDNDRGVKSLQQSGDDLAAFQHFGFVRAACFYRNKLLIEGASHLGFYGYSYKTGFPATGEHRRKHYDPELMPRFGLSRFFKKQWSVYAMIRRGFSSPTMEEVRASDQLVNTGLTAEKGWSYETGFNKLFRDIGLVKCNLYYFGLQQTIVRRQLPNDREYFVNAGSTDQAGAEVKAAAEWHPLGRSAPVYSLLGWQVSYTHNYFLFRDYAVDNTDYSNKRLTGVPANVLVTGISFRIKNISLFVQHSFTDRIPLNDANTVYADGYHLLQAKAGYRFYRKHFFIDVYAGADNILNERYSLGHDLNAFGGRYYNPAPERNYYAGLNLGL